MQQQQKLGAGAANRRAGFWARLASILIAGAVLAIALTVSVLLFSVLLAGGLILLGYILWKARPLRRRMREPASGGRIIEGEVASDPGIDPIERR